MNKAIIVNSLAILVLVANCAFLQYQVTDLKDRLSDQIKVNAAQIEFAERVVRAITKDDK